MQTLETMDVTQVSGGDNPGQGPYVPPPAIYCISLLGTPPVGSGGMPWLGACIKIR
jgi:hypothetical protein